MQNISENRRKINDFCAQTGKYQPDAYEFITECVVQQVNSMAAARHLSAREVIEGVVKSCRREFGIVSTMVLKKWGIAQAADIGEIVYDLIAMNILSASPDDKRSDFNIDYPLFPAKGNIKNFSAAEIPKID